ncbi:MAG: hypothetical protein ACTSRC_21905 [Candidatus Helarchaeota archaeon]
MKEPDFDKNIDILAFLYNELGACGCSEIDEMLKTLLKFLEWANNIGGSKPEYKYVVDDIGAFYFIAGRLTDAGLIEHGVSIRYSWLTDKGERLLNALRNKKIEEILKAEGKAYNGYYYFPEKEI